MEELEPRLLFSADLPGVLAQSGLFGSEPDSTPPAIVAMMDAPAVGVAIGHQEQTPAEAGFSLSQPRAGTTPQKGAGIRRRRRTELPAAHQRSLLKAQAEGRRIEVVVLETGRDGVAQITEAIEERRDVGAVHIVSHGSDGSLTLGDTKLNAYNIERYRDAIKNWQASLTEGADLLIYGCDFAGSAQGREMVETALGDDRRRRGRQHRQDRHRRARRRLGARVPGRRDRNRHRRQCGTSGELGAHAGRDRRFDLLRR